MNATLPWNAIYIRRNCEKKVTQSLSKKGIEHYSAKNYVTVNGFIKRKSVMVSLFPSIIFVRPKDNIQLASLVQLPNVINLVYWKQQPVVIPSHEIQILRNFIESHETVTVIRQDLQRNYEPVDAGNIYQIQLPSIGYTVIAKNRPVTNIKIVQKKYSLFKTAI